jgi:ribosomal protein S18 acetylase RimI-like enzyme
VTVELRVDPYPSDAEMETLWRLAWGEPPTIAFSGILSRSLAHVGAYEGDALIGFVNVAWDGGIHAFILDACVHPERRGVGIGVSLVREATSLARQRGAAWLHVDYEPRLERFYGACGFRPTKAGLIDLRISRG